MTETQRFALVLLVLTFATLCILVLLNVYALELFVVLTIIEFLMLVEFTRPPFGRKNTAVLVVICIAVFSFILYKRTVPFFH